MCGKENCVPFGCNVGEALEMLGPAIIWPVLVTVFISGAFAGAIFWRVMSNRSIHDPQHSKDRSD